MSSVVHHAALLLAFAFHEFTYDVGEQRGQVANLSSPWVGASQNMVFHFYMLLTYSSTVCKNVERTLLILESETKWSIYIKRVFELFKSDENWRSWDFVNFGGLQKQNGIFPV